MAGKSIVVNGKQTSPSSNMIRTLVLLGRTGNGKSATANSILGRKAFQSRASSSGVTRTSELQCSILSDGQTVNVIDTPGLFDISTGSEFVSKEIARCINLAKDGIHAVLVVLSVRARFSEEEKAAVHGLQNLFGSKIFDYMIIVFTGGDELEDNDETLEDYLGHECPDSLKEIISLCHNRVLLFDNKTKNKGKKVYQVQELLSLVDKVIAQNGGQPYTNEIFAKVQQEAKKLRDQQEEVDTLSLKNYAKQEISEMKEQMQRSYEEQLKQITEMVESRMKVTVTMLERQLEREQAARLKVEENAQQVQQRSNEEIRKLQEELGKPPPPPPPPVEVRKSSSSCAIM